MGQAKLKRPNGQQPAGRPRPPAPARPRPPTPAPVTANDLALFLGTLVLAQHGGEALITLDPEMRVNLRFEPMAGPNGEHQVRCVVTDQNARPAEGEDALPPPVPLLQRRTTPIYLPNGGVI